MNTRQGTVRQQTAKALSGLRDMLLMGRLEAGERLLEVALAARLNVSRTPLRAALQSLEREGLVDVIPSGGYQVRRFGRQDITDAIELRGVMEGMAARFAAERGVAPALMRSLGELTDKLDDIVAVYPGAIDFEAYASLNEKFHRFLAEASGSDLVVREMERMTSLPFASPNAFVSVDVPAFQRSLLIAQAQHRSILQAIALREGTRAEALAREHARLARQNLDVVLEEQPELRGKVLALALMSG